MDDEIYQAGYQAGRNTPDTQNPYTEAQQDQFSAWKEGYEQGEIDRDDEEPEEE